MGRPRDTTRRRPDRRGPHRTAGQARARGARTILRVKTTALHDGVLRAAAFVEANLDEALDPGRLARIAGLSVHHFHRVFVGATGETVMGFVRRLRLERAAGLLTYGRAPVIEIALGSGYDSHEAFTRAFRTRFGVPPTHYRDRAERAAQDLQPSIRHEPARLVLARRQVGPYAGCPALWAELRSWAEATGLWKRATACVGLCPDDPDVTDAEKLRCDAGLVVEARDLLGLALPPGVRRVELSAGTYAVALHAGSYDTLEPTYHALLGRALPSRGLGLADAPVVEIYLDEMLNVPAANPRTEVCVRLA